MFPHTHNHIPLVDIGCILAPKPSIEDLVSDYAGCVFLQHYALQHVEIHPLVGMVWW